LIAAGYFLSSNPANSFFYLITGLHGLHLLGGLIALTRTTLRAWNTDEPEDVRTSVQLCTVYWHFMLIVWLVLFALLAGWADDIAYFVELCQQLLI
jgi:cytochrome c oxidase subunit 3